MLNLQACMNKWLLLYLVFNVLASTLPGSYFISVFKIANLFEHYHHHLEDQHDHSFVSFLADHYADKHHQEDHHQHEQLPFHQHEQSGATHVVHFFLTQPYAFVQVLLVEVNANQLTVRSQQCCSYPFSGDIWQPPKA